MGASQKLINLNLLPTQLSGGIPPYWAPCQFEVLDSIFHQLSGSIPPHWEPCRFTYFVSSGHQLTAAYRLAGACQFDPLSLNISAVQQHPAGTGKSVSFTVFGLCIHQLTAASAGKGNLANLTT
jgi:hypothetical protein